MREPLDAKWSRRPSWRAIDEPPRKLLMNIIERSSVHWNCVERDEAGRRRECLAAPFRMAPQLLSTSTAWSMPMSRWYSTKRTMSSALAFLKSETSSTGGSDVERRLEAGEALSTDAFRIATQLEAHVLGDSSCSRAWHRSTQSAVGWRWQGHHCLSSPVKLGGRRLTSCVPSTGSTDRSVGQPQPEDGRQDGGHCVAHDAEKDEHRCCTRSVPLAISPDEGSVFQGRLNPHLRSPLTPPAGHSISEPLTTISLYTFIYRYKFSGARGSTPTRRTVHRTFDRTYGTRVPQHMRFDCKPERPKIHPMLSPAPHASSCPSLTAGHRSRMRDLIAS